LHHIASFNRIRQVAPHSQLASPAGSDLRAATCGVPLALYDVGKISAGCLVDSYS